MTHFNVQKYLKKVLKIIWMGIQWTICRLVRVRYSPAVLKVFGAWNYHTSSPRVKVKHCIVTPSSYVFMVCRFIEERKTLHTATGMKLKHWYSSTVRTIDLRQLHSSGNRKYLQFKCTTYRKISGTGAAQKFGRHKYTCRQAYVAIVTDLNTFFQVRDLLTPDE
jgi:hypothetical protein